MTIMNGYYVELLLCTIIGIIWYIIFKNELKQINVSFIGKLRPIFKNQKITKILMH